MGKRAGRKANFYRGKVWGIKRETNGMCEGIVGCSRADRSTRGSDRRIVAIQTYLGSLT